MTERSEHRISDKTLAKVVGLSQWGSLAGTVGLIVGNIEAVAVGVVSVAAFGGARLTQNIRGARDNCLACGFREGEVRKPNVKG